MKKRIGAAFAAGVMLGGLAMTATGSQAATHHLIGYGEQPIIVTQHTSTFEAPYCVVSERHRNITLRTNRTTVRGPWSRWKVVDFGHPKKATDGTICAVQH